MKLINAMKKKWKEQKGFTLVELVVVMVIIAVIAAFALPAYRLAVERSRLTGAVNYLGVIQRAQAEYFQRNAVFTSNLTGVAGTGPADNPLDATPPFPAAFTTTPPAVTGGGTNSITVTCTRDTAPTVPGGVTANYTVLLTMNYSGTSPVVTITNTAGGGL